ncbi:MAG: hypothetical protein DHS20C01_37780 [marine bacterium B5-7]|nr:MAG: hypothetical protein DHS20C01_37780 [marine bacterium B5-7]
MNNVAVAWIAAAKQAGKTLCEYTCPYCGVTNETLLPPRGEVYDSVTFCMHCNEPYMRTTSSDGETVTNAIFEICQKPVEGGI